MQEWDSSGDHGHNKAGDDDYSDCPVCAGSS